MKKTLIAASMAMLAGSAQALSIEFDTSFDTGATQLSGGQLGVLAYVAQEFGARITDTLSETTYAALSFFNPGDAPLTNTVTLNNQTIAADTIRIFVGAAELDNGVVGFGGSGGYAGVGDLTRGQTGAGVSDVAIWGGAITFNSKTDWYVDSDPATLESFDNRKTDFYSVAIHELAHVLGFGISGSWNTLSANGGFYGPESVAAYEAATGTNEVFVPLEQGSHWLDGTPSFVNGVAQEAAMDPTITVGTRKYFTDLDWAALSDIGWEIAPVAAVPEAHTWAMMLAGLGVLGMWRRRQG